MRLEELEILALDCQTTGSNPANGHILEIGWKHVIGTRDDAASQTAIESNVLCLPEGETVPRRIQRMTGISQQELESAIPPKKVWKSLVKLSKQVAKRHHQARCPLIIHFSKFEEPFLRGLFEQYGGKEFPFEIICTHELSKHLLPQLPRKGIRAVAGYLGFSVPEMKRSPHHVAATVFIWKKMLDLLAVEGIDTLDQLRHFLLQKPAKQTTAKAFPMDRRLRLSLPDQPGIYRMLRSNGDVLYVGKAKSLKQRVNSYFRRSGQHGEHIKEMLTQAQDLKVTVTETALEAALLENDEIKRLTPPYNVALRERETDPVFFSADFNHISPTPDADHPIGPIAAAGFLEPLGRLLLWLKTTNASSPSVIENPAQFLGVPEEYAPPFDCFQEGLRLFQEKYPGLVDRHHPMRELQSLGARLWAERLEQLALEAEKKGQEAEEEEEEAPAETDEPRVWEPDMVLRSLEYVVRYSTYLTRRARWLCALSESTICWEIGPPDEKSPTAACLQFSEGHIIARQTIELSQEPPIPSGCSKSLLHKQQCFDRATYDRLRILTTELRRLVSANRPLSLRISPNAPLTKDQLSKMLPWI
jgi:DNA polymerase-3 subunit epsilon